MTRKVRLHPGAARDLREAIAWYDSQSPGLGQIALSELRRVVERLRLFPEAYRQLQPGLRQASLARLPLHVIYMFGPETIVILAIVHNRRDPTSISRRVEGRIES